MGTGLSAQTGPAGRGAPTLVARGAVVLDGVAAAAPGGIYRAPAGLTRPSAPPVHPAGATRVTVPAAPSTSTSAPSGMARVAWGTASTAGMPHSRAMTAAWERSPPVSVTT